MWFAICMDISFVLVAGPIVLSDGPLFQPRRFRGRDTILNLFSSTFVDLKMFLSWIFHNQPVWIPNQGWRTRELQRHEDYSG